MIRTITRTGAGRPIPLLDDMFRARKNLFVDRLGWKLQIDERGREMDRFDGLSPVYVVEVDEFERHRGSVRLLPTTGDTVLEDRIAVTLGGVRLDTPQVWEYTRFCVFGAKERPLARAETIQVTLNLMLGMCEACIAAGVGHVVGSFDRHMDAIGTKGGWKPDLLGRSGEGRDAVYLGMWETSVRSAATLRAAGGNVGSSASDVRSTSRRPAVS